MIYLLSNRRIIVRKNRGILAQSGKKQFKNIVSLLKEYLERITPYFQEDYEKYQQDLIRTQEELLQIYLGTIFRRRKQKGRQL
jgi:hypothetical protein